MPLQAAARLRRMAWIGLLDDLDGSLARLSGVIGLELKPEHRNINPHPASSDAAAAKLRALMPMDMWLYEYATRIVAQGRDAPMPTLPHMWCRSTRLALLCARGTAMGKVEYVSEMAAAADGRQHMALLRRSPITL